MRYLSLAPFVVAFPFLLFPNRITPLVLFVALSGYVLLTRHELPQTPLNAPIFWLLIMAIVARFTAIDLVLADNRFWNIILQVWTLFVVLHAAKSIVPISSIVTLLLLAILVVELVAIVATDWSAVRLFDLPIYSFMYRLVPSSSIGGVQLKGFINPRIVGNTLGFVVPFVVGCVMWRQFGRMRWLALFVALSAITLILLTQSLMGVLGMVVGFLVLALHYERRLAWVCLAGFVPLVVGAFFVDWTPAQSIFLNADHPLGIAVLLRMDMWRQALAMIYDMPFTGIGLNTFSLMISEYYPGYLIGAEFHAHNLFLQVMLDLGIVGFVAFLALFGRFLFWISKSKDEAYRPILVGSVATTAAYFAGGIFDSYVIGQKSVIILWVIMGISAAILHGEISSILTTRKQAHSPVIQGLVPFVVIALLLISFSTAGKRNLATLLAHKQLAGALHLDSSKVLDDAIAGDPDNPRLYSLRGRLAAEAHNPDQAISDWQRRVEIDQVDTLARYAPFVELQDAPSGIVLSTIYRQWRIRYPKMAEYYVLAGLIADGQQREAILIEGINAEAEPVSVLRQLQFK